MTTTASGRKLTSACNGVTVAFPCPKLRAAGDLSVYLLDAAGDENDAGALLSAGADYAISADLSAITTTVAYPLGKFIRRWRQTSRVQSVEFKTGEAVPAATQEGALDRLSLIDEEHDDDLGRAVRSPPGDRIGAVPLKAARAGKFFAFDADGDPSAAPGTGADGALRTDLAAAANGSLLVLHKMSGGGKFGRSLRQWAAVGGLNDNNVFNWIDSDFDPDIRGNGGLSDATSAMQAGLDAIIAGTIDHLIVPGGTFPCTAGLNYDISSESARFRKRLRLVGPAGRAHTNITLFGVAAPLLNYTGNVAMPESYLEIEGIRLSGDKTIGSWGLKINAAAFASLARFVVEGFDQCVELTNVDQSEFNVGEIRWGRKGLKTNVGSETAANSLELIKIDIGNHDVNGLDASDLNLLVMQGGSIQYCGVTGDMSTFGAKLNNPGTSYKPNRFVGTTFEGNGGPADVWIDSNDNLGIVDFESCGFMRSTAARYAVNNLRIDGDEAVRVNLEGCAFQQFNDYVPDAGRPNIAINNAAAILYARDYLFGSPLEAPSWYQSRWPITVQNGLIFINSGQLVQAFAWDPASLNAGETATTIFAMPGAELGDGVIVSFSTATGVQLLHGEVTSAGHVGVRLNNDTGGTLNENGIVLIRLFKL